jgi:hypothetical protein
MGIVLWIFIFRRQISTILNLKKCTVLFEKKKLMLICQKLDAIYFFYLVGIEVFSKLFHLMCIYSNRIKNKQDTASKVFRQSPCISPEIFPCSPTLVFVAQSYPRASALV